jgi:cytochrome b
MPLRPVVVHSGTAMPSTDDEYQEHNESSNMQNGSEVRCLEWIFSLTQLIICLQAQAVCLCSKFPRRRILHASVCPSC